MRLPDAVLWDMDGTLLDSEVLWDVAMEKLVADLGGVMTEEFRETTLGNSLHDALARTFEYTGTPATPENFGVYAAQLTEHTAALFAAGIPWRPGAQEALALVTAAGIPMALVTNTHRGLTEIALDTLGRDRFAATVCGDEVSRGKPAPDPYLRGAELLGVPATRALAVEDSPTGTAAAIAAGCPVLVVPSTAPVPDGLGRTLRDGLVDLSLSELAAAWETGAS